MAKILSKMSLASLILGVTAVPIELLLLYILWVIKPKPAEFILSSLIILLLGFLALLLAFSLGIFALWKISKNSELVGKKYAISGIISTLAWCVIVICAVFLIIMVLTAKISMYDGTEKVEVIHNALIQYSEKHEGKFPVANGVEGINELITSGCLKDEDLCYLLNVPFPPKGLEEKDIAWYYMGGLTRNENGNVLIVKKPISDLGKILLFIEHRTTEGHIAIDASGKRVIKTGNFTYSKGNR